jgi:hypothetical protein
MDSNWIPAIILAFAVCVIVLVFAFAVWNFPPILWALPMLAGVATLIKAAMDRA